MTLYQMCLHLPFQDVVAAAGLALTVAALGIVHCAGKFDEGLLLYLWAWLSVKNRTMTVTVADVSTVDQTH